MLDVVADDRAPDAAADRPAIPAHAVLLLTALAAGVVAQGGYYPPGRVLVTVLVLAAALVALRAQPWTRADLVTVAAVPLAVWILARAVLADEYPEAVAAVATLACVVAALIALRRTDLAAREAGAEALVWVGALVAVTAWLGVAWRMPRFAVLVENKLWRGGATLTYPNATAALLVPLALLALALLAARPRAVPRALAAYLLLVGVGATLSRAGFLALLVGFLVLVVLSRSALWHSIPPALGAAVAVAALVPSFPDSSAPRPGAAVLGLAAGAVVAAGPVLLRGRIRAAVVAVLVLGAVVAAGAVLGSGRLHQVWAVRGNLDSSGRTGALHAAFAMVAENPFTGTGLGLARFVWDTPDGNGAVALYVHDEYVQTLVDLGAIGAVLLLGLFTALAWHLYRARRLPHPSGIRAGAIAALAAFAVHSGFDFLWHIAVLPLAGSLLIGLAGPAIGGNTISPQAEGKL
jgi:O-Antigen ligase